MSSPLQSSTEHPANPASTPMATVSATPSGASAKQFSKSAETGTSTAAATAAAWLTASSRVTDPSRRPRVAANPPLVVARASKPMASRRRADPTSHGFGINSGAEPRCRARNRSALSCATLIAAKASHVISRAFAAAALIGAAIVTAPASAGSDPASTQQVVVTAPSSSSTSGTLAAYQYSGGVWHAVYGPVPAGLGVHGLSDNRTEGDGTTPTGTYGFGATMYGVSDGSPNPRYAYHQLVCGGWWSGVYDSTYNTFQQIACGQTMDNSEALWEQTTAYQHVA